MAKLPLHQSKHILSLYKPAITLEKGKGIYVYDVDNIKYVDFTSGIAVNALGHAHPVVMKAIKQASELNLIHISNLFNSRPSIELARCLALSLPKWKDPRVFFCNSGTESIEASLKFARKYGSVASKNKYKFISFVNGFHGRTFGSLSATSNAKYRKPFEPLLPEFKFAHFNDIESVKALMDDDVVGIIVEPIQGEGGIHVAKSKFLHELRHICDENDAILIFDEIQCGVGRTGKLWAHDHFDDITPDIMAIAKPLANGLPMGAVIVNEKIANCIEVGDHGSTFGGNPFVAEVSTRVFKLIQSKRFMNRLQTTSEHLNNVLKELGSEFKDVVKEIRGLGLIYGIELPEGMNHQFVDIARDKEGLLLASAGSNTVRIIPPLIITKKEIDLAADKLRSVFKRLPGNQPTSRR